MEGMRGRTTFSPSRTSKTIQVNPEELIFNAVVANTQYTQALTFQNTLSAPVDIVSTSLQFK